MRFPTTGIFIAICIFFACLSCQEPSIPEEPAIPPGEFVVELPNVDYPLPLVDYIDLNCDPAKKTSIDHNPTVYILRGINDIWKGTTDAYQKKSSLDGPNLTDYIDGNPIVDSINWQENIQYVINRTANRTDDETILAYLDDVRSKFYSVIDGFGPLTETYVKHSGAYVDLPEILVDQVLEDSHYQSSYNNNQRYAGDENSDLGAVIQLVRGFQNLCSSTKAPKSLYATPRPWRMNATGEVKFLGTTYDTVTQTPTYLCVDYNGEEQFKIFDEYECEVQVVPGLTCSRKDHKNIYDDARPSSGDLYTNTTANIRRDNGYPSGHTNAGALVSLAYAYAFPERFSELVFRGSQLGEDRILAGMHSPVDVMGGKTMALAVACAALGQPEIAEKAKEALQVTLEVFGAQADSLSMTLSAYAHQQVGQPTGYMVGDKINPEVFNNNFYDNRATIKKLYTQRLTYGFTPDSTKMGQAPIVPKGAENILKSRFPYLTDNQRRQVLYTTQVPSGYKLLDKTNGWGRINLLAAADGFGAFLGAVTVDMDAALGRLHVRDTWANDISGDGHLIKKGSGTLLLTGNNSYSGGTELLAGSLGTASYSALGTGDVRIYDQGALEIYRPLHLSGKLTLEGKVKVHLADQATAIYVAGQINIANSTLQVVTDPNLELHSGDQLTIMQGKKITGQFKELSMPGYSATLKQDEKGIYLVIL